MFRMLIVEDEVATRRGLILTTPWEKIGIEVIGEASNGQEGLELAQKLNPDIILTDIKMPLLNGLDMMEAISKDNKEVVFVVLTAFGEFEYAKRALKLGAVDYLLKPFEDDDLFKAMEIAKLQVKRNQHFQTDHLEISDIEGDFNKYLSKSSNSSHKNILKSIAYIQDNYFNNLSTKEVAEHLQVSESYLNRLFRMETTFSIHEYLTLYRMKMAIILLRDPNKKIFEVAHEVGYNDQRYFSSVFKKYVGVSPNFYKENHKE